MLHKIDMIIIDKCQQSTEVLKKIICKYDLSFQVYENSFVGMEKIEALRPKLTFVCLNMPEASGVDVAVRFSELTLFQDSFIYLLTQEELEQSTRNYMSTLGFTDILQKPADKEKFSAILLEHGFFIRKNCA